MGTVYIYIFPNNKYTNFVGNRQEVGTVKNSFFFNFCINKKSRFIADADSLSDVYIL